ncbi:MAG: 3-dehydroquinate synthase [Deltaproteobacteria bacterium]|nr:3-dehydroquinate synthase [Deltaproteobacteria bacterium]
MGSGRPTTAQWTVRSASGSYPVYFGRRAVRRLPAWIRTAYPRHRFVVLTDRLVARIHLPMLLRLLPRRPRPPLVIVVPSGERTKTRAWKARIEDRILAAGCARDTLLLVLGGGVIGDLGGFIAATYARGIPYVQIPTTLLAQTDSAVGGKTGVDTPVAKNMIGAFYPPAVVLIDPDLLRTLPADAVRHGLVEMIKHGCIADAALARAIGRAAPDLQPRARRFLTVLTPLLRRSLAIKLRAVTQDEFDRDGRRVCLNFGHTAGHAIEQASRYRIPHGDAVAIGMCLAAGWGERLGHTPPAAARAVRATLAAIGAPTAPPRGLARATLRRALRLDKKRMDGRQRLVVLRRLGRPAIIEVGNEDLEQLF